MRCRQYGHSKGKRRANNAALPPHKVQAMGTCLGRASAPMRVTDGPVLEHVSAPWVPITLSTFHKSANNILGTGKKRRPNPVMTLPRDAQSAVAPRLLAQVPARNRPLSKTDRRLYPYPFERETHQ